MRYYRRPVLLSIALALALGSLAACATKNNTTAGPGAEPGSSASAAGGDGGIGGLPDRSPGTGSSGTTGGPSSATYPADAKTYCVAAASAWANNQTSRLKQLVNDTAAMTFANLQTGLNKNWKFGKGDGAAGSTYCHVRNDNGDVLQIQLTNEKLGKPQAVSDVVLERTEYDNDPYGYVNSFINAWYNGNTQRMAIYSNSASMSFIGKYKAPPNWTNNNAVDKGDHWELSGSANNGDHYTFKLNKSLGKAHGITAITL